MGPLQGTALASGQASPSAARQGFSTGVFTKSSRPPRTRRRATAARASNRGPGSRHAQGGQHRHQTSRVEWDEHWNIPRVTRSVEYSELLRDIRLEKVQEVRFFSHDNTDFMTGWCLVAYNDGTVARSFIEPDDFRMAYAMETHGVKALRIAVEPSAAELQGISEWNTATVKNFIGVFAAGAILLIYAATHYVRMKKGDAADREKLRQKAREERKKKQKQMILDNVENEVIEQFKSGASVETIVSRGQFGDADIGKTDVEDILVKAGLLDTSDLEANQAEAAEGLTEEGVFYNTDDAAQREAEETYRQQIMDEVAAQDPNAQAEEMLKMKTIRIRQAEDPIRQRQIREAQRKLRGVKLQYSDAETIFFDDVAGIGDAKLELQEVVDFFTKPERFKASGAKVPRGVLLTGPPGTGKTLLARAVAGEAGVAFLSINASEFVEMFVGVGAARVRDLFGTARAMAPAIVFIDEIDSVGRARGGAQGNDERDQTLNQLLTEMDGFGDDEMEEKDTRVVVLAASNRPDVLDSALVRPGRFDRSVHVGLPDFEGRIAILRVHLDRRRWDRKQVDLHRLAFETRGYSGARLANLVNMASTVAGQRGLGKTPDDKPYHNNLPVTVTMDDLERALEMERLGPPRAPYSDAARRRLALAEATTCTLITLLPAIEPVVKATVVARETFPLGHTVVESNEQRELSDVWTLCLLRQQLIAVLGPRAAEEMVYGNDGASSMHARRIALARRIANKMVVVNAMTDAIGPRLAAHPAGPPDEMDLIVTRFLPEHVSQSVDDAIHAVMEEAYAKSRDMVARNMGAIQAITEVLMRQDTIMGDQVREIVVGLANADDLARRERERADFM